MKINRIQIDRIYLMKKDLIWILKIKNRMTMTMKRNYN
jgi:hypothetical protein